MAHTPVGHDKFIDLIIGNRVRTLKYFRFSLNREMPCLFGLSRFRTELPSVSVAATLDTFPGTALACGSNGRIAASSLVHAAKQGMGQGRLVPREIDHLTQAFHRDAGKILLANPVPGIVVFFVHGKRQAQ